MRYAKSDGIVQGVGKWFACMFFFAFLFYVLIPAGKPQNAGSPFRIFFYIYTNLGATYYEFFTFIYIFLVLLPASYFWIVKART